MKIFFTIMLFLCFIKTEAQLYAEISIGAGDTKSPLVNPGLGFNYHNAIIQADMIALTNDDAPAYMGLYGAYKFTAGDFSFQPMIGRYIELYTTDKYDAYKNTWQYVYGVKLHYKNFFAQAKIADIKMFSIGYCTEINFNR